MTRLALAFIRRDWLLFSSYRFAFVWHVAAVVGLILLISLIGSAVSSGSSGWAGARSFIPFVLAGLAFTDTFTVGLTGIPHSIRDGQLSGTIEPMLLTPIPAWQWLIASSVFRFLQSLLRVAVYISVAVIVLGYWQHANVLSALVVFIPACLTFALLGVLSAAFVLMLKQGDPILAGYSIASGFFGTTLFPSQVLPAWIRPLAALFPLTYALSGMRLALDGSPPSAVLVQLGLLWAMAAALCPVALAGFALALRHAKKEGSLVQY